MSDVRSFEPKSRRETILEEKKNSPKVGSGFLKSSKFLYTLFGVLFLSAMGLTYYVFVTGLEKPFVLSGAETYNDFYGEGSSFQNVVFNEDTGDLEYSDDSSEGSENGDAGGGSDGSADDSFVNNDSSNNNLSPEDYIFNINYVASSNIGGADSDQRVYSVSAAGSVSETLTVLGETLNIDGSIHSVNYPNGEPLVWWGSAHGGDSVAPDYYEPNVFYYSYTMKNPTPAIPKGLGVWEYSVGFEECTEVGNVSLTSVQYGLLDSVEKRCYDSKTLRGFVDSTPVNRGAVELKSAEVLESLGYSLDDFNTGYSVDATGIVNVDYEFILDDAPTPVGFYFAYANGDSLISALGLDFKVEMVGEFGMEEPETAVSRLNNPSYFGSISDSDGDAYADMVSAEQVNPFEFQSSEDRVSIIKVQYADNVDPSAYDTPPGFNNAIASIDPEVESLVDAESNIWSISLGNFLMETQVEVLISEIIKTDEIVFAFTMEENVPTDGADNVEPSGRVDVVADRMVWVLFEDSKGSAFLVKGYVYVNKEENLYYGHVIGLNDSIVGVK